MSEVKLVASLWPETGKALGLSRPATYAAAAAGQIPVVKFGRLKKVPLWWYRQLLEGGEASKSGEAA
jgi:hypothetical protein